MKITREIKTGIIVIGGILLFILGFGYLKSSSLFDNSKTFYAVYKHVGGLQAGTAVSINGLAVGKVNDVEFKDTTGDLLVTFQVDSDFEFSKSSIAEIYDTGIIGGKGIQIKPVFQSGNIAQSGDTLRASIKPGLTDLVQQNLTPLQNMVEGAVSNADSLLVNFNQILDLQTKQNLRESIKGLNELIQSFQVTARNLNGVLANNKENLNSSLTNINTVTTNLAMLSDSLANAGLPRTIRSLETTMANLDKIVSGIQKGEGTMGKLMHNEELYTNLTAASKQLDLLLQDFRLNPKRYVNVSVFGKKQKEYTLPDNDPAEK
ncbi:MAG: MlaD family protein [Cellulophaga sp.]